VTTLDEAVAARLEPFAPSPRRRLRALAEAAAAGLAVACRVDPLIPGINSAPDALARLCDELAQAGVRRIISSTYKHKADNFRRLAAAFSREASLLSSMFVSDARVSGYRYLRREVREEHLGRLRELAHERGLSVSVCREGLPGLNDGVCDARDLRWQ
jgi:DNA repair photolyase